LLYVTLTNEEYKMHDFYLRDISEAFRNYQKQVSSDTDNIQYVYSDKSKGVDIFKNSISRESIAIPTK